ncbi:hypothetical protein [Kangiella marina]|uniref:Uncharacterized protein n=1 Tax=Kangiella marina TaxID=1079178 RepID=A0ABP8IDL8_9GAMM
MKPLFITVIFLLASSAAVSCPNVNGTWKSSKVLSMAYNKRHADLEPAQEELLNQILGNMEISITNNKIIEHELPTIQVELNGKVHDFEYQYNEYSYKTIKCDENSVTIESNHPQMGKRKSTANFINKDTYWVSPEFMTNTREYFIRINK